MSQTCALGRELEGLVRVEKERDGEKREREREQGNLHRAQTSTGR